MQSQFTRRVMHSFNKERPERKKASCAFTVDVEDWYQSTVDFDAPITERVVRNVMTIIQLLEDHKIRASFFVQGLVAMKFPKLLQELVARGHELQSHGHTHRPLFGMSPAQLRTELQLAKQSIEDACGVEVTAFRAPDFSILHTNLWALGALAENGFRVDSSIFPMRTRRYGIAGWESTPLRVRLSSGGSILEAPVAVWSRSRWKLPVAGGGYFRLLPTLVLKLAISDMLRQRQPVILYCHPYEFAPHEMSEFRGRVARGLAFRQGLGRASVIDKFRALFRTFSFGRFDDVLSSGSERLETTSRLSELNSSVQQ